jgi:putative FmdB family regulatory protein
MMGRVSFPKVLKKNNIGNGQNRVTTHPGRVRLFPWQGRMVYTIGIATGADNPWSFHMPIYEFYCPECHVIFNFFTLSVNTEKRPDCPRCSRPRIERQVSVFAISKGLSEGAGDDLSGLDESKMEQAMNMLAREAGSMNEDDPRQAAKLMRRLSEAAGMELGPGMQEAMRRMEAGEDPEQIEAELGDVLEGEEPLFGAGQKRISGKVRPPATDETIYDL